MRLKAENLKEANHQAARAAKHRVGAREMASNARQAELMATAQMLRNKIIVRGGVYGIRGLGRLLKSMDDDGTGDLSKVRNCDFDGANSVLTQTPLSNSIHSVTFTFYN